MPSVFLSNALAVVARMELSVSSAADKAREDDFRDVARVSRELVRAACVLVSASRMVVEGGGEVGDLGESAVVWEVGVGNLVRERRVDVGG